MAELFTNKPECSTNFSKYLLPTSHLFNMALRLSHHDGGIFIAEAGASNSQKSPQSIRACKSQG